VRIFWTDAALGQLESLRDEVRQVIEGPYRIIYLIKEEQLEILALIHTSRKGLPQD
jgi:plasmid stabilization system protein ParE